MIRKWIVLTLCAPGCIAAQVLLSNANASAYIDATPHQVKMVTVEKDIQLEVLDWGGSGRPVVLLAGSGNTAHIFDDFAPKLARNYHVYGITRRGYGASSSPATGYSLDRKGEDIVAVLDSMKIVRPVLVGHSFAGQEVSWVATRFPARIAGAVYLDAAYGYAFYDPAVGDLAFDLPDLQMKLEQFRKNLGNTELIDQLLVTDLPLFERDIQKQREHSELLRRVPQGSGRPAAADMSSFAALGLWYSVNMVGGKPPEAELRQSFEANPDESVGKPRSHPVISSEDSKWEKFTDIRVPVLAIFACPVDYGPSIDSHPDLREKLDAYNSEDCQTRAKALQKDVPSAHILVWPHVYHYLFIAKQDDTLRELRSFIGDLR
jgi:Predicted hydrolases or acyltransferases (alpha/beta hydrolase superfamily)